MVHITPANYEFRHIIETEFTENILRQRFICFTVLNPGLGYRRELANHMEPPPHASYRAQIHVVSYHHASEKRDTEHWVIAQLGLSQYFSATDLNACDTIFQFTPTCSAVPQTSINRPST